MESALAHLELYEQSICDKITLKEIKARVLIQLGRLPEAETLYVELLARNPENHDYYKQLEVSRAALTVEQRHAVYLEYQEKYPRAQAPKRLPLDFLEGAELETALAAYVKAALRKGVPPLFVDLRPLYNQAEKFGLIERMMTDFLKNLQTVSSFDIGGSSRESPTTLLWTYYYLSQHHDSKGDYGLALDLVNAAIQHTPTLIELFLLKGKIYKHAGDPEEAVKWLDEAQSMDTADRYINCKAAKYLLRADKVQEAELMAGKFTREGVPAMDNLNEMQCMWFQAEAALSYQRQGQPGECLKKCAEIDRHFSEIIEDQFDFHTYCMRKMTLKAYVDLLRLENRLRSHKFYEKVARVAVTTYISLFDSPLETAEAGEKNAGDKMDPSELKKLKNKAKKAQRKAEQEKMMAEQDKKKKELHNKTAKKKTGGESEEPDSPAKDELLPEKLERPEDPLEEAQRFLSPLLLLSSEQINTHLLAFEIYLRRGKVLLMLRAIKACLKLQPDNLQLHSCLVRFLQFVETAGDSGLPQEVRTVLADSVPAQLAGGRTAAELNREFMQKHPGDLSAQVIGGKMLARLGPDNMEEAVKVATQLQLPSSPTPSLEVCQDVHRSLAGGTFGAVGKSCSESYRASCRELFPLAQCFKDKQIKSSDSQPPKERES